MYKFTKDCMTGIESIDKAHEQLFKIINEAQALLEEQAVDVKTVKSIVAHLVDYAAEHFAHEEAYMESINDPELMRQKKEHADFANKVKSVNFDNMTDEESKSLMLVRHRSLRKQKMAVLPRRVCLNLQMNIRLILIL